ncbi:CPBP family intramembrane metalloprotease [Mammaliicoccus stepanovicii]|nr:CPBP family intramembrane metalloprotease [Mammaliicoccus stepanovicii]
MFIHFVYILGGYILMYLLDTIYLHFYPLPTNEELLENSTNSLPIWISIVSIAIIPAIIEEIIFRIFILRVVFRNHLLIGLIVSSLAFAAVHDSDTLIGYLPYFLSGLIFGFAYLKTRRIEVPILIHFLNNFFVSISSILS